MSNLELNQFVVDKSWFSFKELEQDLFDVLGLTAELKNLKLEVKKHPNVPSDIFTDRKRLTQILINLVSNGIKYCNSGGITVNIGVEPQHDFSFNLSRNMPVCSNPLNIRFSVEDTGVGIPQAQMHKLFQLFQSVKTKHLVNKSGIGLGLTVSKKLVN